MRSIGDNLESRAEAVELLINQTLKAQGHAPIRKDDANRLPEVYDPAFLNADADLAHVAAGLGQSKSGRLCLYGPPGTGKTAYARWLAEQIGAPLLVRRASDLMSMWVGENEKNIARAFEQADQEGALLSIDEVDSFLQDRRTAQRGWEVSLVNEMLTQMESFSGIFVASTNLMEGLDPAMLRRFDLKVCFDYLGCTQAHALFRRHCAGLGLPEPTHEQLTRLSGLKKLTPGDFATAARQSRFHPFRSSMDLLKALEAECAMKNGARAMGFIHCDTDGKDPFDEAWDFFDRDYDEGWKEDEKESGYEWKIRADEKLITLKDQDSKLHAGNDVVWYFVLPLLALNHVEDLEKLVIRPAIGLLQGNEDEIKNNPQALKFVLEEGIPRLKEEQPRTNYHP